MGPHFFFLYLPLFLTLFFIHFIQGCGCSPKGSGDKSLSIHSVDPDDVRAIHELPLQELPLQQVPKPLKNHSTRSTPQRVNSVEKLWTRDDRQKQESFDDNLGKLLELKKQGSLSFALQKTRDLLIQYQNDPVYRYQLHYLEAELKQELGGERKGLYDDFIDDYKEIRGDKENSEVVQEGKKAAGLVSQAIQKIQENKKKEK